MSSSRPKAPLAVGSDAEIQTLADLLRLEDAVDLGELDDRVQDFSDGLVSIWEPSQPEPDGVTLVATGGQSSDLSFPCRQTEFWDEVDRLEWRYRSDLELEELYPFIEQIAATDAIAAALRRYVDSFVPFNDVFLEAGRPNQLDAATVLATDWRAESPSRWIARLHGTGRVTVRLPWHYARDLTPPAEPSTWHRSRTVSTRMLDVEDVPTAHELTARALEWRRLTSERRPRCPRCRHRPVPIAYGLLLPTPAIDAGDIVIGGCTVSDDAPQWHCPSCCYEWREDG